MQAVLTFMYQETRRFPDIVSEINIAVSDIFGQPDLIRFAQDSQLYSLPEFTSFVESVNSGKTFKTLNKMELQELVKKLFKVIDAILALVSVGSNQSKGT